MIILDLVFAFVVGLLFVLILSAIFGERTPLGSFWILLFFIFLLTWAGGVWIGPFGPVLFDAAWLPFVIVGFFITLILAAAIPPAPPRRTAVEQTRATAGSALAGLTIFVWMILIFSIIAIILAYVI